MKNNEKIGIVVPVYKTEKYVAECIESILAQTYTNFRLILVDDGSPDSAGAICDEYAAKDERTTVIHQENAGVTRARARGVQEAADCEYITFVDSDDTITRDALMLLHESIGEYNITICPISHNESCKNEQLDNIAWRKRIIEGKHSSPCAKLYRRKLFDRETFNIPREIIVGEDLLMNLIISFSNTKDVLIIDKCIYKYRNNDNSCLHNFSNSIEYETLFDSIVENIIKSHCADKETYTHSLIKKRVSLWDRLFGYSPQKPLWAGSGYHKALLNDIEKYQYPITTIEHLLLKTENRIARLILITLRKVKNKLGTLAHNAH